MSQILAENDNDNRSVAASDFVQLDQTDEVPNQQEGQPQFGLHQSLDWTLETGSTHNNDDNGNDLKEMKWMMANLQSKIETLQEKVKNLELEAKIRAMEEKAEQKGKYQILVAKVDEVVQMLATQKEEHRKEMNKLKDEFAQMFATQKEEYQKEMEQLKDGFTKEMAQLESKNRKLEENLMNNVELQTTKNGALYAKMEQLQDEYSKKLAEQQKQVMALAQFQVQFHSFEKKLKEAEQRAQMGKNELEEMQQKIEKFREEMDKNGQQPIGSNQKKLDYMWTQLMVKGKILANPKGIVWDGSKTKASISESGLKVTSTIFKFGFAIATEGFAISVEHCRKEYFLFPGTILYYYEVTQTSSRWYPSVGFTDGSKPSVFCVNIGSTPNSYGITGYDCGFGANNRGLWLSGKMHKLECASECSKARAEAEVIGAGLLLNSQNEWAVFFTLNGNLLGKQTPIKVNPTVDRLYPTVLTGYALEANFGDNLVANPFKFDTGKCPGLVFE